MAVGIGSRLGPYEISGVLGRGGMGEVFRARDSRLQRDVAIKVSAERFSDRFEREARAIAALNHPNICQVYDVGSVPEAPSFLVMELVEGPTLADRLADGAMTLDEALPIAHQIALALEAAHAKAVTHRDLKPANIKVSADRTVKVLDFGLAAFGGSSPAVPSDESPTIAPASLAMTEAGMILGTAAYMAPEQARGKSVDARADIWAYGVVLYEMLSGRQPFRGEDLTETMANVVKEQPNLEAVPGEVRRLLDACLQKDPQKRLQAIGDMRLLIDPPQAASALSTPVRVSRRWPAVAAVATFVAVSAVVPAIVHLRETPPEALVSRMSVPLPPGLQRVGWAVLAPDGRSVAAVFQREEWMGLWIRRLDGDQWTRLDGARGARHPFWSPDSRFLGFFANNSLKVVPASGGPARTLCVDAGLGSGGTWGSSNVILFSTSRGALRRVSPTGDDCATVGSDGPARSRRLPEFLPNGQRFLYVLQDDGQKDGVYVAAISDPPSDARPGTKVLDDVSSAVFAPSTIGSMFGHLLFRRGDALMAQSFDAERATAVGEPEPVTDPVSLTFDVLQHSGSVAGTSDDLLYLSGVSDAYRLTWIDRAGRNRTPVGAPGERRGVSMSSEGSRVLTLGGSIDLTRNAEERAVPGGVWSPDGRQVAVGGGLVPSRDRRSLALYDVGDPSRDPRPLLPPEEGVDRWPSDWRGDVLVYTESRPENPGDIWYLRDPGNPQSKPVRFTSGPAVESQGQLSADGKWLAYVSHEAGAPEVFVSRFPSGENRMKVSVEENSREPRWSRSGAELFYLHWAQSNEVLSVPMRSGPDGRLQVGPSTTLFSFGGVNLPTAGNRWLYSPHPDGQRFLVATQPETPPTLHLITNWRALLKESR